MNKTSCLVVVLLTAVISQSLYAGGCLVQDQVGGNQQLKEVPTELNLEAFRGDGLIALTKRELAPDAKGILAQIPLKLPPVASGLYIRPFSKGHGNRVAPVWFSSVSDLMNYEPRLPELGEYMQEGTYLLLQKNNGQFMALLPVVSSYAGNTFSVLGGSFHLTLATYGEKSINQKVPLLAYGVSDNPYEATQMAWKQAINAPNVKGNVKWRSEKTYPEPYKYLGWCSWEHFKENINEEVILSAIKDIKSSALPIRWVLIDDGYLDSEVDKKVLKSFGVDKEKFPNGWKPITDQKDEKIKWMGIWRNFNGYMGGISEHHTMTELEDDIVRVDNGETNHWMSRTTEESANRFYDAMTSDTKNNGFDIIKVDFQSINMGHNRGSENPVLGVHYNHQALESNCVKKELSLLNCLGQQNFNVFNQMHSAILRGSVDYKRSFDKVDVTLIQNFMNTLWAGSIHWIDHDMFHTSYEETARLMAVARAISGGPIYLSDETKNIIDTHLKPLIYDDGKIVGTLAPGVPLPDSMMVNPYLGGRAFRVAAPLKNNAAVIMAFSLNRDTVLHSGVSSKDYSYASGMLQPYKNLWKVPKEGVLLFDVYNQTAQVLNEKYEFDLETRKERLFQLSPIVNGWAVIGRTDKYLPAGTFELISSSQNAVNFSLEEAGDIFIWSKDKEPVSDHFEFHPLENGLWRGVLKKQADIYVVKHGKI